MKVVELCARKKNRSSHNFPFNLGKVGGEKMASWIRVFDKPILTSMKFELWPITNAHVVY
jgi:hypothetical protein